MCHTPGLSLASNVPDRTSLHHFSSLLVTCATVGGSIWWQGAVAPSGGRGGSSISWPQPHRQRGWWGGVIHGWGSISCTVSGRSFSWGGPLLPAATAVSVLLVLIGIGEGNIPIGGSSKNVQARWGCHEGSFL
jgi:hypothetical protein